MTVLLADDDEDIREIAALVFRQHGLDLVTAASGREAAALLAAAAYDLVVLDETMPPGSGLEVASSRREAGDPVPIVLWTALPGFVDRAAVARLGLTVVHKTDVHDLARTVAAMVSG